MKSKFKQRTEIIEQIFKLGITLQFQKRCQPIGNCSGLPNNCTGPVSIQCDAFLFGRPNCEKKYLFSEKKDRISKFNGLEMS